MTILLIEDEPLIARHLQKLVRQLEPGATIHGPLTSVQGICDYFQTNRTAPVGEPSDRSARPSPDLVIADIQLSDGVSFDAFRQVELNTPVIFTTAYDEYAIRAFKLNSLDYLLKPVDPEEFKDALAKFHRWSASGSSAIGEQLKQFLMQMGGPATAPHYKRRFMGHYLRQMIAVPQEQVSCFLRNELIYLYTTDGKKLITDYKTLDELIDLADPAQFFRANRQYIVNLDAVAGYRPLESGKLFVALKMPNDALDIVVSKEKAGAFQQWIGG